MKYLGLFLLILMIGLVSAYPHCYDDWCCDNDGFVCDGQNKICGESEDWCDNYNNPQLSCMYNDPEWCCDIGGHVIDYSAKWCCPPDSPFYITTGIYADYCGTYDTGGADNYYTRLSQCDYLYSWDTGQFTVEEGCLDYNFRRCEHHGISQWIDGWQNRGATIGECGVTCLSDSQCPNDEVLDNFCNINQIMKTTRQYSCSNYNCVSVDKTEVVETCSLNCDDSSGTPVCVGCDDDDIILLDEVYYICRDNSLEPVLDLVEFSDAEQQLLLEQIALLNLSIEEQIAIVENLQLTLDEKILLVNTLTDKIDEQITLIQAMETTVDEQLEIMISLSLSIDEQALMINELTDNLAIKVLLVSQLTATNEEQANLIEAMELSFSEQADIISQLDNTIQDDAEIISSLNLNIEDQARLISELELSNTELVELITLLNLNIEEQSIIISELSLSLSEEQLLVSQLTDEIEEQNAILELLRQENKLTLENIWQDYKIAILIIGGFLFLLLIGGRKR